MKELALFLGEITIAGSSAAELKDVTEKIAALGEALGVIIAIRGSATQTPRAKATPPTSE